MIYKKHILTKSDITSQIHLPCKSFTKDSIEYKVVSGKAMTTQPTDKIGFFLIFCI